MSEPILPLRQWPAGIQQASVPANDNALRLAALTGPVRGTFDDEPESLADGDVVIIGADPQGAFAAFDPEDIALYHVDPVSQVGGWHAWAPVLGLHLIIGRRWKFFTGMGWADMPVRSGVHFFADRSDQIPGTSGATVRWNSLNQLTATELYIDDEATDGGSLVGMWAVLQPGGFLFIQEASGDGTWQMWSVDSVTQNSGFATICVTLLGSSGVFDDQRLLSVTFQQSGEGGAGIPDAPSDGNIYGRKDGDWVEVEGGGGGGSDIVSVATPSNVSGTVTLDFGSKSKYVGAITLGANVSTLAFTNLPGAGNYAEYELHIKQDATGSRTFAIPASHKALGASDTAIASAANAVTVLTASTVDNGTTWRYAMQESAA